MYDKTLIMKEQNIKNNIEKILNGELKINYVPSFRRHLKNGNYLGEYKCLDCKNRGVWNNKELILELEHIDGDRNNNRRENLKWLCPNCHSQTLTFRKNNKGKNLKKKVVGEENLKNSIKEGGNIGSILKRVGLKATGDNYNRIYKLMNK